MKTLCLSLFEPQIVFVDATMNCDYIQWVLDIVPLSCNDVMIFTDIVDVTMQYWLSIWSPSFCTLNGYSQAENSLNTLVWCSTLSALPVFLCSLILV